MVSCQHHPCPGLVPEHTIRSEVRLEQRTGTYPNFCLRVNGVICNWVANILEMDADLMSWQDVVSEGGIGIRADDVQRPVKGRPGK